MYESYTGVYVGQEEPEVAVVGTKGQIVIPQKFRRELDITPKNKLAVYRKDDKLVLAKLKVPPLEDELKEIFKEIDKQNKGKPKPSQKEIIDTIQEIRHDKSRKGK